MAALRETHDTLRAQLDADIESLREENKAKDTECSRLQVEKDGLAAEMAALRETHDTLHAQLDADIESLREENKAKDTDCSRLHAENAVLNEQIASLQKQLEAKPAVIVDNALVRQQEEMICTLSAQVAELIEKQVLRESSSFCCSYIGFRAYSMRTLRNYTAQRLCFRLSSYSHYAVQV
jgi:chromosome segregation ATPase